MVKELHEAKDRVTRTPLKTRRWTRVHSIYLQHFFQTIYHLFVIVSVFRKSFILNSDDQQFHQY